MTGEIPPLPAGYKLDDTPPLPAGYKMADSAPAKPDTGVMASLKRTGLGLLHLPGILADAFTKPATPEESQILPASKFMFNGIPGFQNLPDSAALGLHRLIVAPSIAEHQKALQLREQAKTQTDDQANNAYNGTNHMANMHDIAAAVPVVGPMSADIVDRYLHGDKSGAVTDAATAVAGPKVAEGAASIIPKVLSKVVPPVAERMYTSALKPSTTIPAAQRASIVQTGLDAGIPVSAAGADKLSGLIQDLNTKIADQIKAGAKAGQTVDPGSVAGRTAALKARFANQVNPAADLKAIDAATDEFKAANPNPIPVDQAQAMKQGTYQQLKARAYGELGSATVEAQKSLARGLKEELQTQFPEIKNLNAQESQFLNLDGALEKALNRIGNHQIMGIGTPIVAGAVGGAAGGTAGVVAGLLKAVIDDPIAKSRLAIALSKAGKISPGAAIGRITQYSNALAQSQNAQQQQ